MRKFRAQFLLVAVALLVPTGLLVLRALESVELERRVRHETVAERLFDEMERALSEFLTREEGRPFGEYGFVYTPPGGLPGELVRSPLSQPPTLPFVVGYFQIDPDGTVRTPLRPRGEEREGVAGDWRPSPGTSASIAEIERIVGGWAGGSLARQPPAPAQLPGSTVALGGLEADRNAAPDVKREQKAPGRQVSAYDALRALNKGVEQRADRQTKVTSEYGASEKPGRSDDGTRPGARQNLERDEFARSEISRFELSPMVGRAIDPRHLLLYRTVVHETQGYRQGMLLDAEALGRWLREHALGATELEEYATLRFETAGAGVPVSSRQAYRHRFAEPFEDLSAELTLAALPGAGGAAYVYALSLLLGAAVVLGLAALYRMTSVVLRFAEQRSNFVAAVTHELKTPLTAIRMYGEMLRDGMVASEAKRDEYHRHITAESERLTRLVNNVLEFSRLENSVPAVVAEPKPLAPVLRELAELVRPHVESGGFELLLELDSELPVVRFERDALMQVLFNLIDNSVKYADGAQPKRITLRALRREKDVSLTVRDHGPGVAPRHLKKIFEPFYRAESELTRERKGTGLGLALVRGLVERMGARVSGRNLPEGGFEVEIVLPSP